MDTEQKTEEGAQPLTVERNTLMAALSYVGPLVIIPFLTAKDDAFVGFHIRQGLVLFVIEIGLWVVGMMLWVLWPLIQIVNLVVLVLAVIGIVNVLKGKEKMLPWVGAYARYFKI